MLVISNRPCASRSSDFKITRAINNGNRTGCSTIRSVIVSITKFSIVIGSPRDYLSRYRRAITWVSNYRCPI